MKLRHLPISVPAGPVWLDGLLAHAPDVRGLVVLVQTSVGQHQESREAYLAEQIQKAGYATLIQDLITRYEDSRDPDIRYNVPLLARRVIAAAEWIRHQPQLKGLSVALVAGGTGCGAAVRAAARAPERFQTLVCRAGRPDLAGAGPLRTLAAPMRLLVGSRDSHRAMLQTAFSLIATTKDWRDIQGAGELFIEPGALESAGRLCVDWLERHLPPPRPPSEEDGEDGEASNGSEEPPS